MEYILRDGSEVTAAKIAEAYKAGKAVLCHAHQLDGMISTSLMLDGVHYDTRGECNSMWEEARTSDPKTIDYILRVAYHNH